MKIKKIDFDLREGFFYNANKLYRADAENATLPKVVTRKKAWHGKTDFIAALQLVQSNSINQTRYFKGWSNCRVCGEKNGSSEHTVRLSDNVRVMWPDGFMHYVEAHNVRPSLAFQEVIIKLATELRNRATEERVAAKRPIKSK